MFKHSLLGLALGLLVACGGDTAADDYQMAVDAADAKQAEAISLAPASPCNAVQQCDSLQFIHPEGHCTSTTYRPYSLVSATAAAASAAAADERALALHAVAIAPPPPSACTASITLPPDLACTANLCEVADVAR